MKIWLASQDSILMNEGEARSPKACSPFLLTQHFSRLVVNLFKGDSPPLIDIWMGTSKNYPEILGVAGSFLTAGAILSARLLSCRSGMWSWCWESSHRKGSFEHQCQTARCAWSCVWCTAHPKGLRMVDKWGGNGPQRMSCSCQSLKRSGWRSSSWRSWIS